MFFVIVLFATVASGPRTVTDAQLVTMLSADDPRSLRSALGDGPGATARVIAVGEERGDLLTMASLLGAKHVVAYLLAAGANVNGEPAILNLDHHAELAWGHTPMYLAARGGYSAIVDLLIRAGADRTRADQAGYGPIHVAAAFGRTDVVKMLVATGVSVDSPSVRGDTSLKLAVMRRQDEVASYLLSLHANANLSDVRGDTPLHEAARNNDKKKAILLLSHGARIVRNRYGRTPTDEAAVWAPDLVSVLQAAPTSRALTR